MHLRERSCIIVMKKIIFFFIAVWFSLSGSAAAQSGVCLMNAVTGEVIYENNMHEQLPPASTTKIMTAIVALENSNLYDVVTMSNTAVRSEGSSTYAKAGDKLYMEDVIFGLMLNSGNDAACAIAETISGSNEDFALLMTKKAAQIGAKNTCFLNPSGLPDDGHYTTAYDLALIARYALQNDKFAEIVSTQTKKVWPQNRTEEPMFFSNHNKLLNMYEGCIGVKTGYTKKAGRCLVSAAERDGMRYIAVTLNDGNDWKNHMEMYDTAFNNSEPIKAVSKGQVIRNCGDGNFVAERDFIIPSLKDKKTEVQLMVHIPSHIEKPINQYEKVGYISIMFNNEEVGSVNIISDSDMYGEGKITAQKSFTANMKELFLKLMF